MGVSFAHPISTLNFLACHNRRFFTLITVPSGFCHMKYRSTACSSVVGVSKSQLLVGIVVVVVYHF